ncbi:MAG: chemotaxis protein CheW [Pelosinus sp.]|nr:chemotaxis protein CheW [Pelosinus sp.]
MTEDALKSDAILRQISNSRSAENIALIEEEQISFLIFQLVGDLFAFYGSQVREILPFREVTWIPGATTLIPGVINVHGGVAAVLDLSQVLRISKTTSEVKGGFYLMGRDGDGRTGILVDNLIDIVEIPASEVSQLLATLDERLRPFAVSQFEYQSKIVIVLDAAEVIRSSGGMEAETQ